MLFKRQLHPDLFPQPTGSGCYYFLPFPGSLMQISSHDQQNVSDTTFALSSSLITSWSMINRLWVIVPYQTIIDYISSQWPIESKYMPSCLMSHISTHHQQEVSNTIPFLYYAFLLQLLPTTIGCEQHWIFLFQSSPIILHPYYQQEVSETTILTISWSSMSYVMLNRELVILPARLYYHISFHVQQDVSVPVFISGKLITWNNK